MDVLILLEDNQFENLANSIKSQCIGNVEINNIDFNLEKSLRNCNVVIYFGKELNQSFFKQYKQILGSKLLITSASDLLDCCYIELKFQCKHNIAVISMPNVEAEVRVVIEQILKSVFSPKYKLLVTESISFNTTLAELKTFEDNLNSLINKSEYEYEFLLHLLHNFNK